MRLRFALARALVRFIQVGDGVEAEAIDAHRQPETGDVVHFGVNRWVVIVQVRLVGEEAVKVELATFRVKSPVGVFRVGKNDSNVLTDLIGVGPHVIVAIRSRRVGPGFLEPVVLVRGVIEG